MWPSPCPCHNLTHLLSTCNDNIIVVHPPLVSPHPHPHLLFVPMPMLSYTPPGLAPHHHVPLAHPPCHHAIMPPCPPWYMHHITNLSPRHPDIPSCCHPPTPPSCHFAHPGTHTTLPPLALPSPLCCLITLISPYTAHRHAHIIDSEGIHTHNVLVVSTNNKFIF